MQEDDIEGSDSDATELYEILADMTGPEEEIEMNLEPEIEPPTWLQKEYNPEKYLPKLKHKRQDLFVNMVTVGSAKGPTIPTTFRQTKCNVLIDTGAMKSCMSEAFYQQLMFPSVKPIYTYQSQNTGGKTSLWIW